MTLNNILESGLIEIQMRAIDIFYTWNMYSNQLSFKLKRTNHFLNLVNFSFENNLFLFVYSLLNPILNKKNHTSIWLVSVLNFSQIWGWCSYFFPKSQAGHVLKMFLKLWEISAWCSYKLNFLENKQVWSTDRCVLSTYFFNLIHR